MVNKSPSIVIGFKIPEETWSRKPASYKHLKIFGCLAYVHIKQGKLNDRAIKDMLCWLYLEAVKGNEIWCQEAHKCLISKDIQFNEAAIINKLIK